MGRIRPYRKRSPIFGIPF